MNSKYSKYFLGAALIVIWSLLFKKIGNRIGSDSEKEKLVQVDNSLDTFSFHSDDYVLHLNFKNPFKVGRKFSMINISGKKSNVPTGNKNAGKTKAEPNKVKPKVKKVEKPKFTYKGFIVLEDGRKVALVADEKRTFNWRLGELRNGCQLSNIREDSIFIQKDSYSFSYPKFN